MLSLTDNLKAQRQRVGLSLEEVAFAIREFLPRSLWVTAETIRKYENGMVPEHKANLLILAGLARVYGCQFTELAPNGAEDAKTLRDLLIQSLHCSMRSARSSPRKVLASAP